MPQQGELAAPEQPTEPTAKTWLQVSGAAAPPQAIASVFTARGQAPSGSTEIRV